jgi:hypothetical protein
MSKIQNVKIQSIELQNVELQNVKNYKTSNLTEHQNTKHWILQNDEIQNVKKYKMSNSYGGGVGRRLGLAHGAKPNLRQTLHTTVDLCHAFLTPNPTLT